MFVAKYDANGVVMWAKQAGGTGDDVGYDVNVDTTGNVYVGGYFQGTASFGNTNVTSAGADDIFLAKYDNLGNLLWVRRAGGNGSDKANDIAVDGTGNCYVAGAFGATATFDSTLLTSYGGSDAFIAQLACPPLLSITTASGNIILSWPKSPSGFSPQVTTNLSPSVSWSDVSTNLIVPGPANNTVTLPVLPSNQFFRLRYQ